MCGKIDENLITEQIYLGPLFMHVHIKFRNPSNPLPLILIFLYSITQACQCNGQAKECNHKTGRCHCTTKGIIGEKCDRCDIVNHYYGDPVKNSCYCKFLQNLIDLSFQIRYF